ncbi:Glycosyltransferase, GT2 family [Pseudomonas sp. NFACC02]|uniref:glycosyltransferase family 2 protein n=1 Tax=Pseudomonas sp. NFACC02 TaxID=1566250 RepID=UPI0008C94D39|nr:glycosyltransferase [Pseudomonas sp. NFACC02]SER59951.1 Glycosyltransferase, GT2 family [Pseudomonas sp. NFACC02]
MATQSEVEYYCKKLVEESGAFDKTHYALEVGHELDDPILHYITKGWKLGFNPHPCFDTEYYLSEHSDVSESKIHPFIHYLLYGAVENRETSPLFSVRAYRESNPEIEQLGVNPLSYFSKKNKNRDRRNLNQIPEVTKAGDLENVLELIPESNFNEAWYLENNPDVAKAGLRAYDHYASHGFKEGRPAITKTKRFIQFAEIDAEGERNIRETISKWGRHPLISIILPVYNTKKEWLIQCLDSVVAQIYPHWQLCVCDDASTLPHIKEVLEDYKSKDARIRVIYRESNGFVAAASNDAITIATGDYIALLDHDDKLEKQATFRLALSAIQDMPDVIYSDEIITTENINEILNHAFRPSYSRELYLSHPYFVHFVAIKKSIIDTIGGFDESLRISQDYDLILRALEHAKVVAHIPEALYRWRTHSISSGHQSQKDVMTLSTRILQKHLDRTGVKAVVEPSPFFNFFNTRYPLNPEINVAIIIPTKNQGSILQQCVQSIESTVKGVRYSIIIVNHDSTEPETLDYFSSIGHKHTVLPYSGEFNFSTINNFAIKSIEGDYTHYLLCNNDIEAIEPGWLERMLELGQQSDVGVVGAKLYYPDGDHIQHAGVCLGLYGAAEHYGKFMNKALTEDKLHPGYLGSLIATREMSSVTAACALVRRDAFEAAGGFDEMLKVGFGDVDLCLRIKRLGYRIIFCPHAELIHHESYSRGKSTTDPHLEDSAFFQARWGEYIKNGDEFYNVNLSVFSTTWQVEFKKNFPEKYHGKYLEIFKSRPTLITKKYN